MRLGNAFLGVIANLLLARHLGAKDYAYLVAAIAASALGTQIAEWASSPHLVRRMVLATSHTESQDAVTEIVSLRAILGPSLAGVALLILVLASWGTTMTQLLIAGAAWLPSLGFAASVVPVIFQAQDRQRAYSVLSQAAGYLWSCLAIVTVLLSGSSLMAACAFALSGLTTAVIYARSARHTGFRVWSVRGRAIRDAVTVWRSLFPEARAQAFMIAPWRVAPILATSMLGSAPAGVAVAGIRYWEQTAIPGLAVGALRVRDAATRGELALGDALRTVLLITMVVTVPACALALPYESLLGGEFSGFATAIAASPGLAFSITVGMALGPAYLAAGKRRAAEALGLTNLAAICCSLTLSGVLGLSGPQALATASFFTGVGTLLVLWHQEVHVRRRILATAAVLTVGPAMTLLFWQGMST
jgi:O-antigen/teichoic acid export membrane protein